MMYRKPNNRVSSLDPSQVSAPTNSIADLKSLVLYRSMDLLNVTCAFMSKCSSLVGLDGKYVTMAEGRRCDLDEELVRSRLRYWNVLDDDFLLLLETLLATNIEQQHLRQSTASQLPAFIMPSPAAGLTLILPACGSSSLFALAASVTVADMMINIDVM
jgi:hypothetical protein